MTYTESKILFNKKQLQYYYNNKQIYKDYYEKNKERIRKYNSQYKKDKYIKKDKKIKPKDNQHNIFNIQRGIFILTFD